MSKTETQKTDWMKISPKEVESIVVDLGKKGESPAKIGLTLRDKHGIPKAKLLGKRISQILKENKVPFKTEGDFTNEKIKNLEKHMTANKHDNPAHRSHAKKLWIVHNIQKRNN